MGKVEALPRCLLTLLACSTMGLMSTAHAAPPAPGSNAQDEIAGSPMSDGERQLRRMLQQRSTGFGGIFAPLIAPLRKPGPKPRDCGQYTEPAACNAYRAGDRWAADRIQRRRSTGAERDWYSR